MEPDPLPNDEVAAVSALNRCMYSTRGGLFWKGKFEDVLAMNHVKRWIVINKPVIVYSFSASYVSDCISSLSAFNVKQIGCCYVYDEVSDDDVIDYGFLKISKRDGLGTYKFGVKKYEEPAVTSESFLFCTVTKASDIIMSLRSMPYPLGDICSRLMLIVHK